MSVIQLHLESAFLKRTDTEIAHRLVARFMQRHGRAPFAIFVSPGDGLTRLAIDDEPIPVVEEPAMPRGMIVVSL